ncbi:hypothetical protein IMSHALPRED_011141 [Imshaugia aleurites]|uniref:Uncharacterized protein n=1 Tax=Imshaugia aleurites TaxID=172621 RepID=A0A8H3GCF2_9LECA|nr:hypothetical protein IMSHALPRED_011141 [Imshaugia aleurites]
MPWQGREPERLPRLSADALARQGQHTHSALHDWYRTPHRHEELAVNGRSAMSDGMTEREREREREREMARRRTEERSKM